MGHTEHYNKLDFDIQKLINFVGFGLHDAQSNDKVMQHQLELIKSVKLVEINIENNEETTKEIPYHERDRFIEGMVKHVQDREHYFNFILSHSIIFAKSLFDYYISNVIEFIYKKYPKILTSKKKELEYPDIFKHNNYEELLDYIIERELYEIGYKSFKKLLDYFNDVLCLELNLDEEHVKEIIKIFEIRNVFVHNNGVVNKKFLSVVDSNEYKEGDEITLDYRMVVKHFIVILRVASEIDKQIYEKLNGSNLEPFAEL